VLMVVTGKSEAVMDLNESGVNLVKDYHPPRLERLGDLRSVTLGGSIGVLESGYPYGNGDPFPTFTP
jgi:hypothetical protein